MGAAKLSQQQEPGSNASAAKGGGGGIPMALRNSISAALHHHQSGRLREAEAIYRDVLRAAPDQPDALHLLGVVAYQTGRLDEAANTIERAIAGNSRVAAYHDNLGLVYRALGRAEDAVHHGRRAVVLDSRDPGSYFNLAGALIALGLVKEAARPLRRAIALDPSHAEAHNSLANLLTRDGQAERALSHYQRAIAARPDYSEALTNLANALVSLDRIAEALPHYQQALAIRPDDPDTLLTIAQALSKADRAREAIDTCRRALALAPDSTAAHFQLALLLKQAGDAEGAAASYRAALDRDPAMADARLNLGNILFDQSRMAEALAQFESYSKLRPNSVESEMNKAECHMAVGDFDAVRACLERTLAIEPGHVKAHAGLAQIKQFETGDERIVELEALLARPSLADAERLDAGFALGKILDDLGRYDEAFERYGAANAVWGAPQPFDANRHAGLVSRQIRTFDRTFFDKRTDAGGSPSEQPVFIVGMPRSGTSLVEQVIASHSEAFGAGERPDINRLSYDLPALIGASDPFPECVDRLDGTSTERLGAEYLAALSGLAPEAGEARRITDKMPGNFLHLGLIAVLFPRARVVHCRRDPMDTCLSCYFQNFVAEHEYAYDLSDLGAYYREYERLMVHWRETLPLPMFEVAYEDLIADQERVSRELITFCGLEWDDACLRFHETERLVRTASYWQVRQPIYDSSVERWRNYDAHLAPLRRALGRPSD
jgi:tetratricopeptide (TPR) repeat protein